MSAHYDMDMLQKSKEFDAAGAEHNFGNREDYFYCLSEFVAKAKTDEFMLSYNPTVVIFSDEVKAQFLHDIDQVEQTSLLLKLTGLSIEIDAMNQSIKHTSVQELSDGLLKFKAKLDMALTDINAAQLADAPPKPAAPVIKPLIIAADGKTSVLASVTNALGSKYKVVSVTRGKTVLEMLKRYLPVMLLIGDKISDMNAYDLADKIREDERFKKTPILFMTSVVALSGDGHVLIPIDRKNLLKTVEKVLK